MHSPLSKCTNCANLLEIISRARSLCRTVEAMMHDPAQILKKREKINWCPRVKLKATNMKSGGRVFVFVLVLVFVFAFAFVFVLIAMAHNSSGRASADKLSWPCIKVICSQNENVWRKTYTNTKSFILILWKSNAAAKIQLNLVKESKYKYKHKYNHIRKYKY